MRDMTARSQLCDLGTLLSGVTAAWRSFDLAKLKSRSGRWTASPKGSAREGTARCFGSGASSRPLSRSGLLPARSCRTARERPHEPRGLAMPVANWHGGKSADDTARLYIAHDAAIAGNSCARPDRHVIADGAVTADHHAIAESGAARDPGLTAND